MTSVHDGKATCSMCRSAFALDRARPVLTSRRMRVHDIYRCPHCSYYVVVPRQTLAPVV